MACLRALDVEHTCIETTEIVLRLLIGGVFRKVTHGSRVLHVGYGGRLLGFQAFKLGRKLLHASRSEMRIDLLHQEPILFGLSCG